MTKCERLLLTADWAAFIARGYVRYDDIPHATKWMHFSQGWKELAYDMTIADAMSIAA